MSASGRAGLDLAPLPQRADVVVIGGGVCGCAVARELSRYELDVVLVDKECEVNRGSSHSNSAMIHSGLDPKPGSRKARFNLRGNELYPDLCRQLQVPFRRCGAYIVALAEEERPHLEELLERGRANGVPELEIISGEAMREREPLVLGTAALWAPTTGIVSTHQLVPALAENAAANGVTFCLEAPVTGVEVDGGRVRAVQTGRGGVVARWVVNAAGLWADEVAALAGVGDFTIRPRKGEYYVFDREVHYVSSIIFPTPTPQSKGVTIAPTTDGNTLIGPSSHEVTSKEDLSTTEEGLAHVVAQAQRLCPDVDITQAITSYAGLRAVPDTGDFIIGPTRVAGFLNVAGIESPGLTAAPAIAEYVAGLIVEADQPARKAEFVTERRGLPRFAELTPDEQARLAAEDPDWGHIICRCEHVTRKEVLAAVRSPVGARTLDGIKFRARAGAGRCQGGFCLPRLINLLAEELGVPPEAVTRRGPGSEALKPRPNETDPRGDPAQG
jgi:glycerol-3-phosphate dehydrogenase